MHFVSNELNVVMPDNTEYERAAAELRRITKVDIKTIDSYLDLTWLIGRAGSDLVTVALEQYQEGPLNHTESELDILPVSMPVRAISEVFDGFRVGVGFNPETQVFSASRETMSESGRQTIWEIQGRLGQMTAFGTNDKDTFVRYRRDTSEPKIYYPFNIFTAQVEKDPVAVSRGFMFGLQEIAGALLAARMYTDQK